MKIFAILTILFILSDGFILAKKTPLKKDQKRTNKKEKNSKKSVAKKSVAKKLKKHELTLTILKSKKPYIVGNPVNLVVVMKNTSTRKIRITGFAPDGGGGLLRGGGIGGSGTKQNGTYSISAGTTASVRKYKKPKKGTKLIEETVIEPAAFEEEIENEHQPFVLAPGESKEFDFDLNDYKQEGIKLLKKPGKYAVDLHFEVEQEFTGNYPTDGLDWSGNVFSNTIVVEVRKKM